MFCFWSARVALEVEQVINPIMGDVGLQGATIKVRLISPSYLLGPYRQLYL